MRPIKLSKKDWGQIVMAVSLGLASIRPSDPYVFVPAFVVAWIAFLYLACHHEGAVWRRWLVTLLVTAALAFFAYRNLALSTHPGPPISIYLNCSIDGLIPIRIPASSTVHVIQLHPGILQWSTSRDSGIFQDISSPSNKARDWPSRTEGRWMTEKEMRHTNQRFAMPPYVFKCTISSDAGAVIEDLKATLVVETEGKKYHRYPVRFDPLIAGTSFTFYVVNACSSGTIPVDAQWDNFVTCHVLGESETRRVPLKFIKRIWPSSLMPIQGPSAFLWSSPTPSACNWGSN